MGGGDALRVQARAAYQQWADKMKVSMGQCGG